MVSTYNNKSAARDAGRLAIGTRVRGVRALRSQKARGTVVGQHIDEERRVVEVRWDNAPTVRLAHARNLYRVRV